jgi:hypothetical protein
MTMRRWIRRVLRWFYSEHRWEFAVTLKGGRRYEDDGTTGGRSEESLARMIAALYIPGIRAHGATDARLLVNGRDYSDLLV